MTARLTACRPSRRPLGAGGVLLAAVLLTGCGSGEDPAVSASGSTQAPAASASPTAGAGASSSDAPAASATPSAPSDTDVVQGEVAGGEAVGGVETVDAAVGEPVTFRVSSDVSDHVHVHGPDVLADVAPGAPAEVTATFEVPGSYEVELEESGVLVFQVNVR